MGDEDGYKAFVTNDLASGKFTKTTASFVDGRFRHGTVMRLSQAEQARVMEAYKDRESDPGQQEIRKPLQMWEQEMSPRIMVNCLEMRLLCTTRKDRAMCCIWTDPMVLMQRFQRDSLISAIP